MRDVLVAVFSSLLFHSGVIVYVASQSDSEIYIQLEAGESAVELSLLPPVLPEELLPESNIHIEEKPRAELEPLIEDKPMIEPETLPEDKSLVKDKPPLIEKIQEPPESFEALNQDVKKEGVENIVEIAARIRPDYPYASRKREEEGEVLCEVEVSEKGKLTSLELIKSSGIKRLDEEALKALKRASYQPATINGKSVSGKKEFKIVFRLR